jgi:hypothetical protein
MANSAVKVGSLSEKRALLAKLVLDMENTATALSGMTAKSPTTIAYPGKRKPGMKERKEQMMKMITHVVVVNSEKAKHRLR